MKRISDLLSYHSLCHFAIKLVEFSKLPIMDRLWLSMGLLLLHSFGRKPRLLKAHHVEGRTLKIHRIFGELSTSTHMCLHRGTAFPIVRLADTFSLGHSYCAAVKTYASSKKNPPSPNSLKIIKFMTPDSQFVYIH